MTLNRVLLLIIFSAVQLSGFTQKGSISGSVVDEQTRESIPFTSVALLTDGQVATLKGTVTDEKGYFILENLPSGT
ncbi:MAG: carboxypeptidase-like regulatory domain-containing protein [Bacteroidales bacterium]|nr:carboxypeptidase-like regulatory domain-containing protein [Bacteroidales bacterium]